MDACARCVTGSISTEKGFVKSKPALIRNVALGGQLFLVSGICRERTSRCSLKLMVICSSFVTTAEFRDRRRLRKQDALVDRHLRLHPQHFIEGVAHMIDRPVDRLRTTAHREEADHRQGHQDQANAEVMLHAPGRPRAGINPSTSGWRGIRSVVEIIEVDGIQEEPRVRQARRGQNAFADVIEMVVTANRRVELFDGWRIDLAELGDDPFLKRK